MTKREKALRGSAGGHARAKKIAKRKLRGKAIDAIRVSYSIRANLKIATQAIADLQRALDRVRAALGEP